MHSCLIKAMNKKSSCVLIRKVVYCYHHIFISLICFSETPRLPPFGGVFILVLTFKKLLPKNYSLQTKIIASFINKCYIRIIKIKEIFFIRRLPFEVPPYLSGVFYFGARFQKANTYYPLLTKTTKLHKT